MGENGSNCPNPCSYLVEKCQEQFICFQTLIQLYIICVWLEFFYIKFFEKASLLFQSVICLNNVVIRWQENYWVERHALNNNHWYFEMGIFGKKFDFWHVKLIHFIIWEKDTTGRLSHWIHAIFYNFSERNKFYKIISPSWHFFTITFSLEDWFCGIPYWQKSMQKCQLDKLSIDYRKILLIPSPSQLPLRLSRQMAIKICSKILQKNLVQ